MHGSFKQVHIKVGRKRPTVLQVAQEGGQVPVDFRSLGSSSCTEEIPDNTTNIKAAAPSHAESVGRRSAVIYLLHDSRGDTALVVERAEEGHAYPMQHPVYFISEVLSQVKRLTAALRGASAGHPLFVAVDQEGGKVARFQPGDGFPA